MPYSSPRRAGGALVAPAPSSLLRRTAEGLLGPLRGEWDAVASYASTIALWTCKFYAVIALVCGWMIGLACSSFVAYLLLYHYLMPNYRAALPVHFDVSQAPSAPPQAMVSLISERQWKLADVDALMLARGSPAAAAAAASTGGLAATPVSPLIVESAPASSKLTPPSSRFLTPGHAYHVYLDLDFPDSHINEECGMQSVEMLLLHDGLLLASSLHSFTPRYSSPLVRWMRSWAWSLPLVTGLASESQRASLHMLDSFVEHETFPTTAVQIRLKSPQAHRFQIYSATLRVQAQLHGLRYLMYHWWISTALVLCSALFAFQLFWSAVLVVALLMWFYGSCGNGASTAEREQQKREEAEEAADAEAEELVAAAEREAAAIAAEGEGTTPLLWQGDARRMGADVYARSSHAVKRHSRRSRSRSRHGSAPAVRAGAVSSVAAVPSRPLSVVGVPVKDEPLFDQSELYSATSDVDMSPWRLESPSPSSFSSSPSAAPAEQPKSEPGMLPQTPVEGRREAVSGGELRHRNVHSSAQTNPLLPQDEGQASS